jgi:agmatine deiminase
MTDVPAMQGWRMPAEWEPHQATWVAWPHHRDDWPGKFPAIPWVYGEIVRHLQHAEEVRILVNGPVGERHARVVLDRLPLDRGRVTFWRLPTDRVWTRDYGPIFLTSATGAVAATDWQFNAWAKYPNWRRDNAVTGALCRKLELPSWTVSVNEGRQVVLEGGSIDVNGQGLLLTTEECLLSELQQRNPGFTRQDYEQVFADYLGVRKVLWRAAASPVTIRMATSMTWPASSAREPSWRLWRRTRPTSTTSRSRTTCGACAR